MSKDIFIYTKETLIEKLREIRKQGWIESARQGNAGGVGNTLEDLLGIEENNLPIPNAAEWELKCQRLQTTSLTTLFHVEPSPTALKFVPAILLPKYGWPHKESGKKYPSHERSFRQTISTQGRSDRGFKVVVDHSQKKVLISFDATAVSNKHTSWLNDVQRNIGLGEINPQPYWGFDDLYHKAGTKLHNCFFNGACVKELTVLSKIIKIIPTTKCVTVHPQLLNYLFNPTMEDRKNYQVQFGPNSKIEMVVTEFSTLQERGLARLPTMAEFKLMLNIWHLAITQDTRFLKFDSSTDVLKQIGYTHCQDNLEMLRRTVDVYWGLSVNFYQYLTRVIRKGKVNKEYLSKQDQTFRILCSKGIVQDKETKELKSVNIEFSLDFWQICHNEEFLRLIDVNKIAKFKSPFALVLYLHLIQWSNHAKPYQKNKLYNFVRFHEELGLVVPEENKRNLSTALFKLQKALKEIKEIDENIKVELDLQLYKKQHKIHFLNIKAAAAPPTVAGRKVLPIQFCKAQIKRIETKELKDLEKTLQDFSTVV